MSEGPHNLLGSVAPLPYRNVDFPARLWRCTPPRHYPTSHAISAATPNPTRRRFAIPPPIQPNPKGNPMNDPIEELLSIIFGAFLTGVLVLLILGVVVLLS